MAKKLEELNLKIYIDEEKIDPIEYEIEMLNEQNLQEQAVFLLLNDCKIKKEFIRLEYRINSYCNIVKLVIPKKDKTLEPDVFTAPEKIRQKNTEHFQDIFKSQNVNKDKDKIKDFLTNDDDPKPY